MQPPAINAQGVGVRQPLMSPLVPVVLNTASLSVLPVTRPRASARVPLPQCSNAHIKIIPMHIGIIFIVSAQRICYSLPECECSSVVERCPDKTEVEGSIPSTRTRKHTPVS